MATKEEIIGRIEIMQAWIDGEEIESSIIKDGGIRRGSWRGLTSSAPAFNFKDFNYRIKPSPREVWEVCSNAEACCGYFDSLGTAQEYRDDISGIGPEYQATMRKYREVLEGYPISGDGD